MSSLILKTACILHRVVIRSAAYSQRFKDYAVMCKLKALNARYTKLMAVQTLEKERDTNAASSDRHDANVQYQKALTRAHAELQNAHRRVTDVLMTNAAQRATVLNRLAAEITDAKELAGGSHE